MPEAPPKQEEAKNYNILIEPIFRVPMRLLLCLVRKRITTPIQSTIFEYGLKVKNLGANIFPGAEIKNIGFESAENKTVCDTCDKEIKVNELNPDGEEELWIEKTKTDLEGLMWIHCDIRSSNAIITTCQNVIGRGSPTKYDTINQWGTSFYIQAQYQLQQRRTNFWLMILTLLIFLESIWGLKNIALFVIDVLRNIFLFLAELLRR